jgi:hypothetical protein
VQHQIQQQRSLQNNVLSGVNFAFLLKLGLSDIFDYLKLKGEDFNELFLLLVQFINDQF